MKKILLKGFLILSFICWIGLVSMLIKECLTKEPKTTEKYWGWDKYSVYCGWYDNGVLRKGVIIPFDEKCKEMARTHPQGTRAAVRDYLYRLGVER